ncbi:MAG: acyl-CoA dehydrogenase family protein [Candidatus Solibacter usitatus]|nr:acyl-CoA dehydrogenase family protein [Candidatus Solibacter usitatus]
MATASMAIPQTKGGAFLIESRLPEEIYSPEDFTEEHLAVAKTADEFWLKEILPNVEKIQHQEPGVAISVLKKSAELGLTAVIIPECYGGMELDLTSMMIVAERVARDGSYSAWHGAHTGIGTLPLLFYGTEAQKKKYLPKLASAEMIAAYCLSEPHAGSDALAAKTRADLTADGKHYVLNGQKMWITNGGAADLYTIFAKIGGDKFTAFLVERNTPGLKPGNEEKKMGIKGSSTTPIYLDNVRVPVENVLGEVGKGHHIAFNILNLGRFKIGPFATGGAKQVLLTCLKYAKERKAFGKQIGDFGMIQHKLAEMAIRIFAVETMSYRVVGMIDSDLGDFSWSHPDASQRMLKAAEEFAMECSYMKVYGSEMLNYVVDEGVQIHGGYGYHQDYAVERAYRDSRINRIFEGTNEINRMLATGMLLKRAQRGQLPLVEAVKRLQAEILAGPSGSGTPDHAAMVANAKKVVLFCLGVAYQAFPNDLDQQQEVLAGITDAGMSAFAMESVHLRAERLRASGKGETVSDMNAVFLPEAMEEIEKAARYVLSACSAGDALRTNLAVLKRFTKFEPVNSVAIRRKLAKRLLDAERYTL